MIRKLLLLTAAIACSMAATEAVAQITPNTGNQSREQQRTQEKSQLREELETREARYYVDVRQYGVGFHPSQDTAESMGAFQRALTGSACIARTVGENVDKALGSKPMSRNEEPRLTRAFGKGKGCTKVPTGILSLQRGLLSSGSYLTSHEAPPTFPEHVDESLVQRFRVHERDWNEDRVPSDRILIDAANCLVVSDLELADALVRSEHGSAEEEAMMDRLFVENAQCAGPGRPPNVSRSFMRSFLSDALYRASVYEGTAPLFGQAS